MRRLMKFLGVLLLVVAALAVWKREEIGRLQSVLTLFDADRITDNFSHMDAAFLSVPVPKGDGPALPLPPGPAFTLPAETDAWIAERHVTALVIVKDGQLRHESYYLGTGPMDRRISWSVAKSFLSALMGTLVAEGTIDLDAPVERYAPALKGSAYEGATVRQVANMTSGVAFNEDYLDFWSDINKMGRVLALGGSMDDFAAGITARRGPPGGPWQYVSIDTHVLGMVIRGASGREIADLMSDRILEPLGLEVEPYYLTDGYGQPFVLGGLNLITRDYARVGELFRREGQIDGRQIVPRDWVDASTRPQADTPAGGMGYGYQWWIPPQAEPGEFMAQGVYGQFIYVNRRAGVTIASNAADRGFTAAGVEGQNVAMFRSLVRALEARDG
ncbi:class C beta-lactamase-related serine hydrolase [Gemmobacter lutimaris]|uniref:Class C beta-lactamase-related serine hydrolase n=1 Tax=Gemmobacter lutimaris TaxID=2306023 RepID=A0A398BM47_9RHOB|nr:serine hydrolase [Gemmobacter lutimaris]RID91769.1 class C beta-lactamase-related serine hydrolase [Gemmobacter lutimaris]